MAYFLDTLAVFRNLTAAGFKPAQAEAIVAILGRRPPPLTRDDLRGAEGRLQASLATRERRALGAVFLIAGLLVAAQRLFA